MEEDRDISGQLPSRPLGEVIATLARSQHGVLARRQLLEAGFSRDVVDYSLTGRRLHAVHRGVYSVSPTLTQRARWMAATLAAGPNATLSHRSAAALYGLRQYAGLEVTTPNDRRIPSVTVHRTKLPQDERTTYDGIPITGISRTLLDLAAVLPTNQLERAARQAESRRLTDTVSLTELLARYPKRRGTAKLRHIAEQRAFTNETKSDLEDAFLELAARASLPRPQTNVLIEGFECDAVWRRHRLVVEVDSRRHHLTTSAFESDRRRDRVLQRSGWRVVRVTHRQLRDPALVSDLQALLSRPSRPAEDRQTHDR